MNVRLIFILLTASVWMSCKKDNSNPSIATYLSTHNITNYKATDSGLVYVIETEGTGNLPQYGQKMQVNYTGYLLNDKQFDSNQEGTFYVVVGIGSVIVGWDEGLKFFKKGSKGTLYIPSALAYGESGSAGVIGENEDLKFEIEVLNIQ